MMRSLFLVCFCVWTFSFSAAGSDLPAPFRADTAARAAARRVDGSPPPISEFRRLVFPRREEGSKMLETMWRLPLPGFGMRLSLRDNCVGVPTASTPYDRYMQPVHEVMGGLSGSTASMERVDALMRQGRRFAYAFNEPYTAALPERTAATRRGDCKSKSLWLCQEMGDSYVRFVVGKLHSRSRVQHAWLYWRHSGRWWILDCTTRSHPVEADSVGLDEYIPYYSYDRDGAYRHRATEIVLASGIPATQTRF